jgi:hypothetical protein
MSTPTVPVVGRNGSYLKRSKPPTTTFVMTEKNSFETANNPRAKQQRTMAEEAESKEYSEASEVEQENSSAEDDEDERNSDSSSLLETEEDAQKLLEEMEIHDFDLSDQEEEPGNEDSAGNIKWETIDWDKRMKRDEIFSKRYKPSASESKELHTIASELSVQSRASIMGMIQVGMGTQESQDLESLLFGEHSIVVKRGPLSRKDNDCELVLFTNGFILTFRNPNFFNPLAKRYETCHLWTEVEFCCLADDSVVIQLRAGDRLEFQSVQDGDNSKQWLQALERIMTEHAIHNPSLSEITEFWGWQYILIRKPGFTAAVTGDMSLMGDPQNINELDIHNKFAPLHYALLQETCNTEVIEALLDAGADPNVVDGEGRSPMYYAAKNKLDDIKELLIRRGGEASKLTEIEQRGELFGRFEQSVLNTERRREKEKLIEENKAAEAAAKTQSVQDQMNKNMAALIERGEKIEHLDTKTKDLEAEAQDFGQMAAQLKDKMKKKKWYQL